MPVQSRRVSAKASSGAIPCVCRIEGLEDRRMLNAADLDISFSGDGQYLSADAVWDYVGAVKRQEDGKLVVAGTAVTANPIDYAFYIQRFHADGTPDDAFG